MIRTVGVIGTGAMGGGVVRSLVRGGMRTLARDIDPVAAEHAMREGAEAVPSAAALARACDLVIVLVVDAAQVDDVLFGRDGVASAGIPPAPEAERIVAVSSTIDPQAMAAFAPRIAGHGWTLLDAPVSGGPARAAEGTMTMMLAGPTSALARAMPVLERISRARFVVSERAGDASVCKIVNNLLAGANLAAAAEAMALAQKCGMPVRLMAEIVAASSGASWICEDRIARALADDYAPRAATRVLAKDVGIAVDLADRLGVSHPVADVAQTVFAAALAAGHAEQDDAALFKHALVRAGLPPRVR